MLLASGSVVLYAMLLAVTMIAASGSFDDDLLPGAPHSWSSRAVARTLFPFSVAEQCRTFPPGILPQESGLPNRVVGEPGDEPGGRASALIRSNLFARFIDSIRNRGHCVRGDNVPAAVGSRTASEGGTHHRVPLDPHPHAQGLAAL